MNKLRLTLGAVLLLALMATVAGCARKPAVTAPQPVRKFKVAFVYPGTINDEGWTQAQDQGRRYLQQLFPDVETSYMEAVSPGDDAERMLVELAEKGNKVIFATDSSYSEAAIKAAKWYPKTVFMVCSGDITAPNVGIYTGRMYQPRYLAGLVAGKMTKHNLIGYVANSPSPEDIRNLDAFTLGARQVNSKAKVKVFWTHSVLEPQKEKDAVKSLIKDGADIVVQQRDDPGVRPPSVERTVHFIGSDGDLSKPVPLDDLACTGWNWGPVFAATVKAVQDGTWKSGESWGGMADHIVGLAPLNPMVPDKVLGLVNDQQQQLLLGKKDVFVGPIKDQKGAVRLKAGQKLTDKELDSIDWFVAGIEFDDSKAPNAQANK